MFYVYELVDPLTNKVFYVGKGSGKRVFDHFKAAKNINSSRRQRNPHLYRKINKILLEGFCESEVIRYLKYFDNEHAAYEVERKIIENYGLRNLCNITPGGEGGDTFTKNPNKEEIRKKISKASKGRKLTREHKDKISKSKMGSKNPNWKGKSCYDSTRQKKSKAYAGAGNPFYGKSHTKEVKEKIREIVRAKTSKLTFKKVREIRQKYKTGKYSQSQLSKEYEVGSSTIGRVVRCEVWKEC